MRGTVLSMWEPLGPVLQHDQEGFRVLDGWCHIFCKNPWWKKCRSVGDKVIPVCTHKLPLTLHVECLIALGICLGKCPSFWYIQEDYLGGRLYCTTEQDIVESALVSCHYPYAPPNILHRARSVLKTAEINEFIQALNAEVLNLRFSPMLTMVHASTWFGLQFKGTIYTLTIYNLIEEAVCIV